MLEGICVAWEKLSLTRKVKKPEVRVDIEKIEPKRELPRETYLQSLPEVDRARVKIIAECIQSEIHIR